MAFDPNIAIRDLGQHSWAKVSKKQLNQIDIQLLDNKCQDLSRFMDQHTQHTGFIPLSPLQFGEIKECDKCIHDPELCKDPVKLYDIVNSFQCPNFLGARVQVNYDMNLDLIDKLAEGYWDWHLPLFLRYGFPMDFKGSHGDLISASDSHPSALQFPEHVTAYLTDEMDHQAIYGPFKNKPFGGITHISPFITHQKQDSNKRRVIIDLSWPNGASVNHYTHSNEYMGTAFKLCYPSVDTFTDRLRKLGRGALMHKIDLSRAFRQLKVDPADYPLLCLFWQGNYYVDGSYAFGHRTGAMGCSRLTDFLRYVHSKQGYYLMSYIDDLLGAEVGDKAQKSFDTMCTLLRDLNIPTSPAKLTPPTTRIICLGIEIDSVKASMSIPENKLEEILLACKNFKKLTQFTKKQLQSLLGSLMFIHKVVHPARYFVNRLLETLRGMDRERIPMSEPVQRDINWFLKFVKSFNGTATYIHTKLYSTDCIQLDACLTGIGGRFNECVYTYQFRHNEIPSMFTIVHLEMWNVLVALRLWGHMWAKKQIIIECDNEAVVSVVNSGVTKDTGLGALVRNIWLETALKDIQLKLIHVKGKNNQCADLLSRWHLVNNNWHKLMAMVHRPVWFNITSDMLCIQLDI